MPYVGDPITVNQTKRKTDEMIEEMSFSDLVFEVKNLRHRIDLDNEAYETLLEEYRYVTNQYVKINDLLQRIYLEMSPIDDDSVLSKELASEFVKEMVGPF